LEDVTISERRRAIIENPGITSWFIQKRMALFLKTVINKLMPFKDSWYRYEWQHRGSGHVHGFLWIESAPKIDQLDLDDPQVKEMLCDFHDQFVSTTNPAPGLFPGPNHPCQKLYTDVEDLEGDYAELVNRVQLHTKCSKDYCIRINKKTKKAECRFGYPKDIVKETIIEQKENGPIITTARNDPLVNSHNRILLQAWRANMDIKPIISSEFVLRSETSKILCELYKIMIYLTCLLICRYVSKYCTKSEIRSDNLQDAMLKLSARLDPDESLKTLSQKLLIHSVGERDYSAQETCHLLQSLPLYHSSRTYVTVNTYYDSTSFKVKKRQVGITDGILEISNLVHTYKHRPKTTEFRNMSLLEFATNFVKVKEEIKRRKPGKEAVVIVLPYIQKNETDPNYCRYYSFYN